MELGLRGKNALVTGGTKGIGRAIAECFASEGANVSICARTQGDVDAVVKALRAKGGQAFGQAIDVANKQDVVRWIDASAAELGGIDALICNVSAQTEGNSEDAWHRSFQVDMMHTVSAVEAALPHLEKSTCASIAIVSSVSGLEIGFFAGAYGAIKAALIHYSKGLSRQLARRNIRVNCVCPGSTYFDGGGWQTTEKVDPELFAATLKNNPTGRFGTAEEVAPAVVFLASVCASRISGAALTIDGALTVAV